MYSTFKDRSEDGFVPVILRETRSTCHYNVNVDKPFHRENMKVKLSLSSDFEVDVSRF